MTQKLATKANKNTKKRSAAKIRFNSYGQFQYQTRLNLNQGSSMRSRYLFDLNFALNRGKSSQKKSNKLQPKPRDIKNEL